MRKHARTFTFAARFLDRDRRHATEVLYAFFRTLDDLVDERPPNADIEKLRAELQRWDAIVGAPERALEAADPLARALATTMLHYQIPSAYPQSLLRGLEDDLDGRPITSFDDLERYSFRVAGSVGLAMCHVLGATTHAALTAASALGIAMQLTNILRDVDADLSRGRTYLPADEIAQFDGAYDALRTRRTTPALQALIRHQIGRARHYYAAGALGVPELPARVRFPIRVAIDLYGEILCQVERQHHDVFAGRAVVGRRRKLLLAGRSAFRQWSRKASDGQPASAVLGPAARAELVSVGVSMTPLNIVTAKAQPVSPADVRGHGAGVAESTLELHPPAESDGLLERAASGTSPFGRHR
ncbi:MAG: phytoene/squalene synthase family protein [Chloroflexota bacterium]